MAINRLSTYLAHAAPQQETVRSYRQETEMVRFEAALSVVLAIAAQILTIGAFAL